MSGEKLTGPKLFQSEALAGLSHLSSICKTISIGRYLLITLVILIVLRVFNVFYYCPRFHGLAIDQLDQEGFYRMGKHAQEPINQQGIPLFRTGPTR